MNAKTARVMDHETRLTHEDHQALRLWLRLLTCTSTVEAGVRQRLRERFETTLPRFDLMAQLERAPEGLNMGEISRRLMVTCGNVTGITEQLRNEGLVSRESDPDDRRYSKVTLTPAGKRSFAQMARAHEEWIIELFGGLTEAEMAQLYRLLAKLKGRLAQTKGRP